MPWLLNEDAAMKGLLQGITVTDANAPPDGRAVPVVYRLPETEIVGLTYPCIIIEHLGWFYAPERAHRGYEQIPYAPEGYPAWWDTSVADQEFRPADSPYAGYFPIPYNFDYQVTVMSRYYHEHLLPIVSDLAQFGRLHPVYGYLDVPQDGTKRSLFVNAGPEYTSGKDDEDKHLLQATYNVRVCSELLGPIDTTVQYGGVGTLVTRVITDISCYTDLSDLSKPELVKSFGKLSVGTATSWNTQ